jgi:hypothetical protein
MLGTEYHNVALTAKRNVPHAVRVVVWASIKMLG